MLKFLILIIILGSCSTHRIGFKKGVSNPQINQFVAEFEKDFNTQVKTHVAFTDDFGPNGIFESTTNGVCLKWEDIRSVHLNPNIEDQPRVLKMAIYHELLHCVFDLPHYDKELDLMNTKAIPEISKNLPRYINKIKNRLNNN